MKALRGSSYRVFICCLAIALATLTLPSAIPAQQTKPAETSVLASGSESIALTVTVLDKKGGYVDGLEKSYFTVYDGKTSQQINFFSSRDEPISVGIILDASGSMDTRGDRFKRTVESVASFMQASHQENNYFLIGFNESPQLLVDWTRDRDKIVSKVLSIEPKLNTALYDACYLAVEKITRSGHTKRVLLLISDGQDNASHFTFRQLEKLLQESDVLVYSVAIPGSSDPGSSLGMEGQAVLDRLATVNGGRALFPNKPEEIHEVIDHIAFELRHQYQLGFRPDEATHDGKWHKIKVKVTLPQGVARPDLKIVEVRTRQGYYASKIPR